MPAGQAEEIIALALVLVVHVIGAVLLVWALVDPEQRAGWRRRWRWRGGGDGGPDAPQPPPRGGDGARVALPLSDARPSRVRLREPGRAAEAYPRPARRPAHPDAPERAPAPAPASE